MENTEFRPFETGREAQFQMGLKYPKNREYKLEKDFAYDSLIRVGKVMAIKQEKNSKKFVIECDGRFYDKNGEIPRSILSKLIIV